MVLPSDNPKNAFNRTRIQKKIYPVFLMRQSSINSAQQQAAPFVNHLYFGKKCEGGGW
tara:strand:- start:1665 stop:1838 length:174 start_codon:yes stop_codon:yes gene_type:complete